MPPLIAAMLLGAGVYAGLRVARHFLAREQEPEAASGDASMAAESQPAKAEKDLGPLEPDPATGIYRPANPRE
jgi:hypothetical protein